MAGTTRLELATSAVTGQRSNQLNYVPAMLPATGGGGFESVPCRCNQFITTISRSRKVDNRSSIRSRRATPLGRRRAATRREISNGVANVRFARPEAEECRNSQPPVHRYHRPTTKRDWVRIRLPPVLSYYFRYFRSISICSPTCCNH